MNFDDEIIDDYLVTSNIKKLWATHLDILEQIDKVCDRHGLRYFADSGTLLGAARHQGFIPWDDDLDIVMFYDDFIKFVEYAKQEMKDPYFVQTWKTEEGFYPWYIKIRKSDTTCLSDWEIEMSPVGNRGIFIDVFPMYNVPEPVSAYNHQTRKLKRIKFLFECYQTDRALSVYKAKSTPKRRCAQFVWKICKLFTSHEKLCQKYIDVCNMADATTKCVGNIAFQPGVLCHIWDRDIFNETLELPFEDRTIHCPKGYDERLRIEYGNWNERVKHASAHSALHFSADVPYDEYLRRLKQQT